MEKKFIYLDDVRKPTNSIWILVDNYNDFVAEVEKYGLDGIDTISLDHDLGISAMSEWYRASELDEELNYENIKEKTGYDAAKFLVELSMDTNIPLPRIFVHSANEVGSENIMKYINNYLKSCGLKEDCIWIKQPFTVSGGF